eukprot:5142614-Pyramimonas_sp.AAC.1
MIGSVVDLRPSTLLPVIYKWHSRSLLPLLTPEQRKHSKCQFAFRSGFQAEQVVFRVRQLTEKCSDCYPVRPLVTHAGDTLKAYDYSDRAVVAAAGVQHGAPKVLLAGRLRE